MAPERPGCHLRAAPILEYVGLDVIASGAYDVTPDRQPILGPLEATTGSTSPQGSAGTGS